MSVILVIALGFAAATVVSELVLGGSKLQTGLARTLGVHAALALLTAVFVTLQCRVNPAAILIFWAGAFLSWFGVRSHIESSIALRLVYFLRSRTMTAPELIRGYQSDYGEAARSEELVRAGWVERRGQTVIVTPKGEFILRVLARLR